MAIDSNNSIGGSGHGNVSTQGPPGPANILKVGTVETLPAGSNATVEITGESPAQVVSFGIPRGAAGSGGGSGISVPETWDAPGSVIFGYCDIAKGVKAHNPGDLVAASTIQVGNIRFATNSLGVITSGVGWVKRPSGGTWRMHGSTPGRSETDASTTVQSVLIFQRVDGYITETFSAGKEANYAIRGCAYSSSDNSSIDCEIDCDGTWIPFTASETDISDFCQQVYKDALSGNFGEIAPYIGSGD